MFAPLYVRQHTIDPPVIVGPRSFRCSQARLSTAEFPNKDSGIDADRFAASNCTQIGQTRCWIPKADRGADSAASWRTDSKRACGRFKNAVCRDRRPPKARHDAASSPASLSPIVLTHDPRTCCFMTQFQIRIMGPAGHQASRRPTSDATPLRSENCRRTAQSVPPTITCTTDHHLYRRGSPHL